VSYYSAKNWQINSVKEEELGVQYLDRKGVKRFSESQKIQDMLPLLKYSLINYRQYLKYVIGSIFICNKSISIVDTDARAKV
jgi:hypothetical protein